ncbi:MAG: Fic family protein [Saprospiraceae bacterium]|nr:Fic family protein [Saprospiraceae bacterium]
MEVLNKIAQLKAELDSLRPLDKDREAAIMQKLRLDWNYHSNHLEGNSLTFGETKALILFGITAAGKPLKDHFEMTGHDEAVKWVEDIVKDGRPLTENFIRELHELLLKEPSIKRTKTPDGLPGTRVINVGVYKTVPNHVETVTGEIFRFATPEETPARMHDLIEWYRNEENDQEKHPLLLAAEFHYKFILIHPFDDGNGRTARILMNFILMKHGYPPVVVKTEDKANYIAALQQSDAGIITPFIEYIGQNLAHSLEIMLRGARGENIDEADDVDKEIALITQKVNQFERKVKSISTIDSILSNSLGLLFEFFVEKQMKLSSMYEKALVQVKINGEANDFLFRENTLFNYIQPKSKNEIALELYGVLNEIKQGRSQPKNFSQLYKSLTQSESIIDNISIGVNFENFIRAGIQEFDYKASIDVAFKKMEFEVGRSKGDKIVKKYSSQLTSKEIEGIVLSEVKTHIDHINQQIELSQQKHE